MADLNKEMNLFHDKIALDSLKKASLRVSRDAIREKIRKYFRETLKLIVPKFRGQGSYAMGTTVNPLDGEFDIDDGVYLQHIDSQDQNEWPTPQTVHGWIVKATDGHTAEKPIDKSTCVRVRYAGQYHVDLPSYGELNDRYLLAVKGQGWRVSDPMALTDWFKGQVKVHGEQLRRIVRYLKAWADFQANRRGKMPNGLILTVLAADCFSGKERDDASLADTMRNIAARVHGIFYLANPVDASEELTARLSDAEKKRFQEAIEQADDDAGNAIQANGTHEASKLWRKQLGDRFPLVEKQESQEKKKQTAAAIMTHHAANNPPKPWWSK